MAAPSLFDHPLLRLLLNRPLGRIAFQEQHNGATINGTMIGVKVDRADPTPLHDQVAAQIRRSIAEGDARPGDRLPPARDLAAVLGVNTNTVLRALRALREERLLEFRRGLGVRVAGTPDQSVVLSKVRELVAVGRHYGYPRDELVQMIQHLS